MASMKIISLNIWGGREHEAIMKFLADHQDIDVFCFQEVYHDAHGKDEKWLDRTNFNAFADLKKALPDHQPFYHPHLGDWWGLAMFVKKTILVSQAGEHYVHLFKGHNVELEKRGYTAKNIQYAQLILEDKPFIVLNLHGLWNGQGKTDTEARITQSKNIIAFIKGITGEYIFCGDFNLLPTTESIKILERELGVHNLITEYGITSTRTALYTKENKFADYIFVSPGVTVQNFVVLPDQLSDHAALFIECSI